MYKRYFRMKNPKCKPKKIEWIEMTGNEFYRFVNSPEGCDRHFIDMDGVVLETGESEVRSFKAEKNHSYYIQAQVEAEIILRMEYRALCAALHQPDKDNRLLIHALYLADERKTERDLAKELGVSQNAINKQKKKILQKLKILVVKIQKSQQ